jgi:hypothetical protein
MIEREEVDEGKIAKDVEHRPARIRRQDLLRPRLVDLDVLEETFVRPGERSVRLIRAKRGFSLRRPSARSR